jgi:hypothetical protein
MKRGSRSLVVIRRDSVEPVKDERRISKVEPSFLQRPLPLGRIERDAHGLT